MKKCLVVCAFFNEVGATVTTNSIYTYPGKLTESELAEMLELTKEKNPGATQIVFLNIIRLDD